MGFVSKFVAKVALNAVALYILADYFPSFVLQGGIATFVVAALLLALLNVFVRPILTLISTPLIWLTFGLFNIIIHILILKIADIFLTQVTITDTATLFWGAIILAVANSII